jgi:hypothetical protein
MGSPNWSLCVTTKNNLEKESIISNKIGVMGCMGMDK